MLHPSYTDLLNVVNKEVEQGEELVANSRYSIVMATSKRARQIIAGDEPLVKTKAKEKPLSIAVRELNEGQIRILTDEEREAMEARMQAEAEAEEQKPANTETEENNN